MKRKQKKQKTPKTLKNRIITWGRIRSFVKSHPEDPSALGAFASWYDTIETLTWANFADVRAVFGSARHVGKYTIFKISGNKYRLICEIDFKYHMIFICDVLTHEEYDLGQWNI